jgi:hypothetical protein
MHHTSSVNLSHPEQDVRIFFKMTSIVFESNVPSNRIQCYVHRATNVTRNMDWKTYRVLDSKFLDLLCKLKS